MNQRKSSVTICSRYAPMLSGKKLFYKWEGKVSLGGDKIWDGMITFI